MTIRLDDRARSVLGEGRQVYVAVNAKHGPHVTPELYGWADDTLWFAAAASTLKAKVLSHGARVGALVAAPGKSVVMAGTVEVFDPRDWRSLRRGRAAVLRGARGLVSFTTRNAPDLLGFVRDMATGRLGIALPPRRVLFAITPDRAALVENDEVATCWGWTEPGAPAAAPPGGERAIVAVPGPTALPARWFADDREVFVPAALLELAQVEQSFDLSFVVDRYRAPGPAAKRGVLVRGHGYQLADRPGFVHVDVDDSVAWDGIQTRPATVD